MKMRMTMLAVAAGLMAMPGLAVAQGGASQGEMNQPSGRSSTSQQKMGAEHAQVFKNKSNFKIEGTVASVDASTGNLTVQRKDMPPAELKLAPDTKIQVNGKSASAQELQPGSEVRAEFNLAENQPIAVSVDAKASKSQKSQQGSQGSSQQRQGGSSY
ncbi:MAG TPA: hypothetical protein VGD74_00170 [Vulgatibacter sp.]